mmetsp:Transcript_40526/g.88581  ORF Transcript_40526/g.88581 Transcript_40526/m.88581 type:complete len:186 (+) Transcript_40526:81-638(+)
MGLGASEEEVPEQPPPQPSRRVEFREPLGERFGSLPSQGGGGPMSRMVTYNVPPDEAQFAASDSEYGLSDWQLQRVATNAMEKDHLPRRQATLRASSSGEVYFPCTSIATEAQFDQFDEEPRWPVQSRRERPRSADRQRGRKCRVCTVPVEELCGDEDGDQVVELEVRPGAKNNWDPIPYDRWAI